MAYYQVIFDKSQNIFMTSKIQCNVITKTDIPRA